MEQNHREQQQKQEKIKTIQEKCVNKEAELTNIENNYKVVSLKEEIKEQEKIIQTNKALYEAGAISLQEQEAQQGKLEQLKRELDETKSELEKTLAEELTSYQEEIQTLKDGILELKDQYTLNEKKSETVEVEQLEENIISPISGYIQTVNIYKGTYVAAHEQIVTIIPDGIENRLSFELSEEAASKVVVGQEVSFMWTKQSYKAQVIKKSFNEKTGNIEIFCEVSSEILDKMNLAYSSYRMVNVEVSKASEEYSCIISNSAIQKVGNQSYVYVVEEKEQLGRKAYILRQVVVQVLEEGDYESAISANLDKEMKVVNGDLYDLSDGQEVTLK